MKIFSDFQICISVPLKTQVLFELCQVRTLNIVYCLKLNDCIIIQSYQRSQIKMAILAAYLLKPGTSKNDLKKLQNDPRRPNILKSGKFGIFHQFSFFRISSQNAQFQAFWAKKYHLSNLLPKFSMFAISKVLISNLTFVSQNYEPKCPSLGILGQKKINFLILTKFRMFPILQVMISKSDICFPKF